MITYNFFRQIGENNCQVFFAIFKAIFFNDGQNDRYPRYIGPLRVTAELIEISAVFKKRLVTTL